jgi:hypothetical protein
MDRKANQKSAGLFTTADEIDVSQASIEPDLSKVWFDEERGSIAVSIDRLLFDNLTEVAARYLEPNGFSLNLENVLAVIDSMRLGVFAAGTSKPHPNVKLAAKKLMPALCMQLPKKNDVGKVLRNFYDEIGRYESELARLQDSELKARQSVDMAIKDESARRVIENLRVENLTLRADVERIQKKLVNLENAFRETAPVMHDDEMPSNARNCVVRSVRVQEGVVLLKTPDAQFTFPLKNLEGTPVIGAKAVAFYEGGVARSVWIYDPLPKPFVSQVAKVMSTDGRKIKIKFPSRKESIIGLSSDQTLPARKSQILCEFSGEHLVALTSIATDSGGKIADLVFDEQTRNQLKDVVEREAS